MADAAAAGVTAVISIARILVASMGNANATGVNALVVAGGGGSSVWPSPSEVALGVSYGPTGSDYVGTKPPGGAYLRRR